jgi:hypothetical protein
VKIVLRPSADLPESFSADDLYGRVVELPGLLATGALIVDRGTARASGYVEVHDGGVVQVWLVRDERLR